MVELFKLFGTIAINNESANAAIDETTRKAASSQGKMGSAFSKIGSAFSKVGSAAVAFGKVATAGLATGGAAVAALGKSALDGYADFEQLVGGVETLFKESGQTVLKYAENAYKTAGMSANEYMETVTSFSASLIKSLDGDTAKAAEKANQAITDMSDNANKMGSDITSIQNAYQGFAKQNYTMLDNLKLGYGGTKEEMARLLADAKAISGIEYDISSYADIVDAIHVIQTEMGITGTTAKEASATISGSLSATKSAWQNLVAGLGNENADVSGLFSQFVDSALTAANNIVPRIEAILKGITGLLPKLMPKITSTVFPMIQSLLPGLIDAAVALINSLVDALPDALAALMGILPFLLEGIVKIFDALVQSLPQFITMICEALPTLIPALIDAAIQMVESLVAALPEIIVALIEALPGILKSIGEGLVKAGGAIIDAFKGIFNSAKEAIGKSLDGIKAKVEENGGGIKGYLKTMSDSAKQAWGMAFDKMDEITGGKMSAMKAKIEQNGGGIKGYFKTMTETTQKAWSTAFNKMNDITGGKLGEIKDKMTDKLTAAKDAVIGIFEKIKSGITEKIDMAKNVISGIVDKIKGIFNFDFKLPKIKMPHFSIQPSGWKIGDLLDGKIPKLGIEWYAQGGVMEKPTIFGRNGNNAMVGGEAGAEAIAPISTLQTYIREAVAEQNVSNYNMMGEAFTDALREVLPDMQEIVKVVPDENGIFRVVRDKAREYTQKTGNPSFA